MDSFFNTFFKSCLFLSLCLFLSSISAQERTIKGKVVNERGDPLIGVSVIAVKYINTPDPNHKTKLKSRNQGTVSDVEGKFELLTKVRNLTFSYIGFTTQVLEISEDQSYYKVRLLPTNYLFDAPTIVGHLLHPTINLPITRRQISIMDPIAINEILSNQSGIQFQSGSINTNRLSIRGIGSRSPFATSGIKAYIGEIPIHDLLGESTIEDFGLQFIDQISTVKGHTGPGYNNGIGGAILMDINYTMPAKKIYSDGIKFQPSNYKEHRVKDLSLHSDHNIGAYGLLQNQFSATYKTQRRDGETLIIKAQLGLLKSDGYRANNSLDRKNFQSSFYHQVKQNAVLTGILSHTFLDAGIPSSLSLEDYNTAPEKAAFIWEQSKGFERYNKTISGLTYLDKSTRFDEVSMSGYLHRLSSLELRPFNTLDSEAYTIGSRLKVTQTLSNSDHHRINWTGGLDIQLDHFDIDILQTLDTVPGALISSNKDLIAQYNHYQKLNLSTGEFRLEGGFDLGWRQVPSINNQSKGHLTFAPHLDIRKNIMPENTAYLRAGKGYLYPTPDQYIDGDGNFNTELNPSSGYNLELGLKNTSTYVGSPIRYHVAIYHMWLQEQLTSTQNSEGNTIWTNGGRVNLAGLEVGLSYSKEISDRQRFSIDINHTENFHRFSDFEVGGDNLSGNHWTGSPERSSSVNIQYQYAGLTAGIRSYYVSNMPVDDANTIFNESYLLLKSRLGYSKTFLEDKFTLSCFAEIDNLTDIQYSPMVQVNAFKAASGARYYYPGLPRNVIGSVRLAYRISNKEKRYY